MKISNYMPKLYENNLEMLNIIGTEEQELETNLKPDIDNSFLNTFAIVANEDGIKLFENMFDIKPNPDDTLEFRRERIINRLIRQIPFTERFMIQRLNQILGEGNWSYILDYNTYSLTINSTIPGRAWYNELLLFLNEIIPCNIELEVIVYAATWDLIRSHFDIWEDIDEMTWQEVMDAEWLNS